MKEYRDEDLKSQILGYIFEKLYIKDNVSEIIKVSDLEKIHKNFKTSNGSTWARTNHSYLGKKYEIKRERKGNSIFSVQVLGKNKNLTIKQEINKKIHKEITSMRCCVIDVSDVECDHKDGRKSDLRLNDVNKQLLDDFQPMNKTVNVSKREHCKKCIAQHRRYEAKKLGYSHNFFKGDIHSDYCEGCYWHDPKEFNRQMSKNFKK
ncbi:MAG: hypothetical protein ACRC4L_02695 [Mycoplasma sp.]